MNFFHGFLLQNRTAYYFKIYTLNTNKLKPHLTHNALYKDTETKAYAFSSIKIEFFK